MWVVADAGADAGAAAVGAGVTVIAVTRVCRHVDVGARSMVRAYIDRRVGAWIGTAFVSKPRVVADAQRARHRYQVASKVCRSAVSV